MEDNDAKLVARIANSSPIAFESAIESIADDTQADEDAPETVEDANPWASVRVQKPKEEEVPVLNKPPEAEKTEKPEEPEKPEEVAEPEEENEYDDYSQAALVAMQLKESRGDLFDEIDKDLEWEKLISSIDSYISDTIDLGSRYKLEQIGKANQYVQFLLDGGSPEVLQDAVKNADLTNADIETADEQVLEQIIHANLEMKGLSKDDIDTVVKTAKLQKQLKSKAENMQNELREQEFKIMERDKQRRMREQYELEQRRKKVINTVNEIIDDEEIRGYRIDDSLRQDLKRMIFEPSEVIEQRQPDGKVVQKKATLFDKLKYEFDQDLEKQVAFAIWLMKGADFSEIAKESVRQKDNRLLEELRKREGSYGKKMSKVKSGYIR